eukprot:TRINITY_DN18450_c0_g1_i2.p1 TRINITY_DN18450_c0_g1~~TRINITY_DN18450_c0_g1_i2.p1  ORF type:complete len:1235 (+),score=180.44 TRINITY_DN18450_c0_g1_i2:55-3705(+)
MAAGHGGSKEQFLAIIEDCETAFAQLQARLLAVKETALDLDLSVQEDAGGKHVRFSDVNADERNSVQTHGNMNSMQTQPHAFTSELREPEVLKEYALMAERFSNEKPADLQFRKDPSASIGQPSSELRLNHRWLELAATSQQAMDVAAEFGGDLGSIQSVRRSTLRKRAAALRYWHTSSQPAQEHKAQCCLMAPHSWQRVIWDIFSIIVLAIDAFTLPVMLAWPSAEGAFAIRFKVSLLVSIVFWSLDIVVCFNTGFYSQGSLIVSRPRIAKRYLMTWFAFDIAVISLDIAMTALLQLETEVGGGENLGFNLARVTRIIRAVRFLRIMKVAKLTTLIEEMAVVGGTPWLIIVLTMVKTIVWMVIAAHFVSCMWVYLGRLSIYQGMQSWLDLSLIETADMSHQYMHAVQWVLSPPTPAPIHPLNSEERVFNIFIMVFTISLIGVAIGKFTSSLSELRALTSEMTRKRREVRVYLQSQNISKALTLRVMKFVDFKLSLQEAQSALDLSLISHNLQLEINVSQNDSSVRKHPLFSLTCELYPQIYAKICGALRKHVFEKSEIVFHGGSLAHELHITSSGKFILAAQEDVNYWAFKDASNTTLFDGVRFFAEPCIFVDCVTHLKTLVCDSYANVCTISGEAVCEALKELPACAHMFCEYAKDFVALLKRNPGTEWDYDFTAQCAFDAIASNAQHITFGASRRSSIHFFPESNGVDAEASEQQRQESGRSFVAAVLRGEISDQWQIMKGLEDAFGELTPKEGAHAVFSLQGERERALSSCLSVLNLLGNQYENFTDPQGSSDYLTEKQWEELRKICAWCALDEKSVYALLVLLVTRGLGKSRIVSMQLPPGAARSSRPEHIMTCLMHDFSNVVPSVEHLDHDEKQLILETLEIHAGFNFAQLLQGENVPASIAQLRAKVDGRVDLFRFYVMFLVGFMGGIAGGTGSLFLDANNAHGIITGCKAVLALMSSTPRAIYWSYFSEHAGRIGAPSTTATDLVLARLACLCRVKDFKGYLQLWASWMAISAQTQQILMKHFFADGISQRAFVLEFLPRCFSNVKNNSFIQLSSLLEVIRNLVEDLWSTSEGASSKVQYNNVITVDLSDLAEFIAIVRNRFVFQTCISRCKFNFSSSHSIFIQMTTSNWSRAEEQESDVAILSQEVGQIRSRMEILQPDRSQRCPIQPVCSLEKQPQSRLLQCLPSARKESAVNGKQGIGEDTLLKL